MFMSKSAVLPALMLATLVTSSQAATDPKKVRATSDDKLQAAVITASGKSVPTSLSLSYFFQRAFRPTGNETVFRNCTYKVFLPPALKTEAASVRASVKTRAAFDGCASREFSLKETLPLGMPGMTPANFADSAKSMSRYAVAVPVTLGASMLILGAELAWLTLPQMVASSAVGITRAVATGRVLSSGTGAARTVVLLAEDANILQQSQRLFYVARAATGELIQLYGPGAGWAGLRAAWAGTSVALAESGYAVIAKQAGVSIAKSLLKVGVAGTVKVAQGHYVAAAVTDGIDEAREIHARFTELDKVLREPGEFQAIVQVHGTYEGEAYITEEVFFMPQSTVDFITDRKDVVMRDRAFYPVMTRMFPLCTPGNYSTPWGARVCAGRK
jgi:hypothetical protein